MRPLIPTLALGLCLAAAPALAGIPEVVKDHALPNLARFAKAGAALDGAAQDSCLAEDLRPAFNDTFDAWLGVSHLTLGPLETDGRGLAIAFWPDSRGLVPSTLARLIADADPIVDDPQDYPNVSVAARGLAALEYLLYDDQFAGYGEGDYTCRLVQAVAGDLAGLAGTLDQEWRDGFAETLLTAGKRENQVYLTRREARQALFTALTSALEFTRDQRLGRPLGSFDRPRPARAEARRSGRSLRNVDLSLAALDDFAAKLATAPIPQTEEAFDRALQAARDLDDPVFAGVADPMSRFKVEALQQKVSAADTAVQAEIGPQLGVSAGFNASDGD